MPLPPLLVYAGPLTTQEFYNKKQKPFCYHNFGGNFSIISDSVEKEGPDYTAKPVQRYRLDFFSGLSLSNLRFCLADSAY